MKFTFEADMKKGECDKCPFHYKTNIDSVYEFFQFDCCGLMQRFINVGKEKLCPLKEAEESPSKLIKVEEAARLLDITPKALYQRVYRGQIPYIKFGEARQGRIYFTEEDLTAYIEAHRVEAFATK